jgi:ubiquinone/menaquinone biosynthesis C-methylase UbiE
MGLYQQYILPKLIQLAMRRSDLAPYRSRVVPSAEGRVLEIGVGSGLNLPLYSASAERVIGLDPSPELLVMAREQMRHARVPIEFVEGSAEAIAMDDGSVDTVVTTWTLCSIPDASRALREMRRVLKPGGRLLFVEHGRAPDASIRWWQDNLTPIWRRCSGGCHLNRAIGELIGGVGFRIERMNAGYIHGRNPMTFIYEGSAKPH